MLYLIRWLVDFTHLATMLSVLIIILYRGSCSGFSGKCQILYVLVYTARYSDIFVEFVTPYDYTMKGAFIIISYLTVVVIFIIFRSTYKSENDTLRIEWLLFICMSAAIYFNYAFSKTKVLWTFSIYLEAVALLPQYFMHKHLDERGRIISVWYAYMMGLYRFLYILNWVCMERYYDHITIFGGVVQIGLLLGFIFYLKYSDLRTTGNKIRNFVDTLSKSENGEIFYTESSNPNINDTETQYLIEQLVKSDEEVQVHKNVYTNRNIEPQESEGTTSADEYDKLVRNALLQDKLINILEPDMDAKVPVHSQLN